MPRPRLSALRLLALPALLLLAAPDGFARNAVAVQDCRPADAPTRPPALEEHGLRLSVAACYHYVDRTGDYTLTLSRTGDRGDAGHPLSTAVAAQLFRRRPDGTPALQWTIRDRMRPDEAGVGFVTDAIEFPDLAGDGVVTLIVVLRFRVFKSGPDDADVIDGDAFSGRLKLVFFHDGTEVVIHAITGGLDDERSTRATDSFFALPKKTQAYLVHKMRAMYEDDDFGFDNSDDYRPHRYKRRPPARQPR